MKKIYVSKGKIFISCLFLAAGIFFFVNGLYSALREKSLVELDLLNRSEVVKGTYIVGNVGSCVTKDVVNLGSGSKYGISQNLTKGWKEYVFFTVPINDGYIRIMVSNEKTIEDLNLLSKGEDVLVYLEGEVVNAPLKVNYEWYTDIEGIDTEKIVTDYVIKEVDISKEKYMLYIGLELLVFWGISMMFFIRQI